MLGKYYRVGFYGHKFGKEIDGKEFIYKEPKSTHLFELTERLKVIFFYKFFFIKYFYIQEFLCSKTWRG